jgi:protein-tyrosine phosphatase
MKVLMICLGNICRSPLAEGVLAQKVDEQSLDWKIDSCGTGGWHAGEKPDKRSIDVAKKNGIDISRQQARKFRCTDIDSFDMLFVMDKQNYDDVIRNCHTDVEKAKVRLILSEVDGWENAVVPDPYYGGDDGFDKVFMMIDKACDAIIEKYK